MFRRWIFAIAAFVAAMLIIPISNMAKRTVVAFSISTHVFRAA